MWKHVLSLFCFFWLVYLYSEDAQYGRAIGRSVIGALFLLFFGLYMLISNWRNKNHQKKEGNFVVIKKTNDLSKNKKKRTESKGTRKRNREKSKDIKK